MESPTTSPSLSLQDAASLLYRGTALAPMVRASTTPLRTLALQYGADFVYTEELVDQSLLNTTRVVNDALGTIDYIKDTSHLSAKQKRKLNGGPALLLRIDRSREKGRLVCQLGTGEPQLAVQAALRVHGDVDAIDINMGCPKKFSVSGGMGSALLEDPERASKIVRAVRDAVSGTNTTAAVAAKPIPVSAKIRLLRDTSSTVDFVSKLVDAGANAVAIHGRRRGDREMQSADWGTLKEVVSIVTQKFPQIPFLLNGDFYTRDEFTTFQQQSGAAGVLLARPALYNVSIFRKPPPTNNNEGNNGMIPSFGYDSPLLLDRTRVVQDYLREATRYEMHYKNTKYVVCEMMGVRRTPAERVRFLRQKFPGGQTIQSVCRCQSLPELCDLWSVPAEEAGTAPMLPGEHTYLDSYNLRNGVAVEMSPKKHPAETEADGEEEKRKKICRP